MKTKLLALTSYDFAVAYLAAGLALGISLHVFSTPVFF